MSVEVFETPAEHEANVLGLVDLLRSESKSLFGERANLILRLAGERQRDLCSVAVGDLAGRLFVGELLIESEAELLEEVDRLLEVLDG